jgi:hypothetical protein
MITGTAYSFPEHMSSSRFKWGSCYTIFSIICNVL